MIDEKQIRHVIELARTEINKQKPRLALEYLRRIQCDIEALRGTAVSAEHQLAYAEAFDAMNDPASEMEFEDAINQVSNLPDRDPLLEMRCHEHFAANCPKGRRERP